MFVIVSKAVYTTVKQLDIIFSYLISKKGLKKYKNWPIEIPRRIKQQFFPSE